MFSETPQQRFKRLERQAEQYPELNVASPSEVFSVDRFLREQGQQPTAPGRRTEDAYLERQGYYDFREAEMRQRPNPQPNQGRGGILGRLGDAASAVPDALGAGIRSFGGPGVDIAQNLVNRLPGQTREETPTGVMGLIDLVDRPGAVTRGFLSGNNPADSVRRAYGGFLDPLGTDGQDLGFVRQLPEGSAARMVAGIAGEVLTDPTDLIFGAPLAVDLARGGRRIVQGMSDDATEAALRAAEGPLEASTRAGLRRPSATNPIVERAVQQFGTTDTPRYAGFITPDGRLLDISEEVTGGTYGLARAVDESRHLVPHESVDQFLGVDFKGSTGSIRIGQGAQAVDIQGPVTQEQIGALRRVFASHRKENPTMPFRIGYGDSEEGWRYAQVNNLREMDRLFDDIDILPPSSPGAVDPVIPGVTPRGRAFIRGGAFTPEEGDILSGLRRVVDEEAELRRSGIPENEIRAERARRYQERQAELERAEYGQQVNLESGRMRSSVPEAIPHTPAQRKAIQELINEATRRGDIPNSEYDRLSTSVGKALDGIQLMPSERASIARFLGDDVAAAFANPSAPLTREATRRRPNPPPIGRGSASSPPPAGAPNTPRRSPAAREAQQNVAKRDRELIKEIDQAEREAARAAREAEAARRAKFPDPPTSRQAIASEFAERSRHARAAQPSIESIAKQARTRASLRGASLESNPEASAIVRQWRNDTRELLDAVNEDSFDALNSVRAAFTGNFADSYVTTALQRRAILARTLANEGFDEKAVRKITDLEFEREMLRHYNVSSMDDIPENVQNMLERARTIPREESLDGLDLFVQRAKNTMFGLDASVFGVQLMTAVRRGGVPMLAGAINRALAALNMPFAQTALSDISLPKRALYSLDGLATKSVGVQTAAVRPDTGTLLRYVPGAGFIDRLWTRAADKLTSIQFDNIMGYFRELIHEGDLAMLHVMGKDISDPAVRKAAAANANHATSWAEQALRDSRRRGERITFTSSPMTRARIAQINDMAKVFLPGTSAEERMMGAMMITSTVAYTLAVGKLVNDQIGVGEMIFDPSVPGFGLITSQFKDDDGRNIVIDVIPQDSVERAFARSIRELMNGDPAAALRATSRVYLGSASIIGRIPPTLFGYGFEPGKGWAEGNMTNTARVLNLAPLPPYITSAMVTAGDKDAFWPQDILKEMQGDPLSTSLDILGFSNWPESPSGLRNRLAVEMYDAEYSELTPSQKKDVNADPSLQESQRMRDTQMAGRGDIESQRNLEVKDINETRLGEEVELGKMITEGMPGPEIRESYNGIQQRAFNEIEGLLRIPGYEYGDLETPQEMALQAFRDVFLESETPWGDPDYDERDKRLAELEAELGPELWDYVQENTGLKDHAPEIQPLIDTRKQLAEVGFFDIRESAWRRVQETAPPQLKGIVEKYDSYYDYRDAGYRYYHDLWIEQGGDPDLAVEQAVRAFNRSDVAKAISDAQSNVVKQAERNFMAAYPDLARKALRFGYICRPDQEELDFLSGR